MRLFGEEIVFLCLICASFAFASAAKVSSMKMSSFFQVGKKNITNHSHPGVPIVVSSEIFNTIFDAKISQVLDENHKLGKQLSDNSKEIESMKRSIENQTLSLKENTRLNEEFVTTINENRKEMERLNRVNENQTLIMEDTQFFITLLNEEFGSLNQLLQSNDQKVNACATREEMDGMNVHINSILDRIQKRSEFCEPNPCLNGGRCELTATGNDYECTKCTSFLGKHCEILNCGGANACYQLNHTGYFVFESKVHITWEEAEAKCLSEGMVLAQPKDKGSTEFLISQLQRTYDTSHGGPWFWIGFKYNANDRKWYWVDGSAMGNYTGDNSSFTPTPKNSCGLIYLYGHLYGDEKWTAHDCAQFDKNQYHSLCEKRLT